MQQSPDFRRTVKRQILFLIGALLFLTASVAYSYHHYQRCNRRAYFCPGPGATSSNR